MRKKMPNKYSFTSIYETALSEWPNFIVGSELGELREKLDSLHIGQPDEVIFRSMHDAIGHIAYRTMRPGGIEAKSIDCNTVKSIFDKKLEHAKNNPELGWLPADLRLVDLYFSFEK